MAKELPYFKFEPNQWENGNIQFFGREIKGLFIDLCSMYWSRLGELDYALALQKLCNGNTEQLNLLMQREIFVVENEKIVIEFLDEQLDEFQKTSKVRAKAARKRWDKSKSNANALQIESKSNAIREDKSKENKIIEYKKKSIEERKREFYNSLTPYVEEFSKQTVRDFYEYWSEHGKNDRKFRKEKEKSFSIERRLKTWKEREKNFAPKKEKSPNGLQQIQANQGARIIMGLDD